MTVITVSGKDKPRTDNKRAKVTTVNDKSLWVEFLEGPSAGEAWQARTFKNVRPFVEEGPPQGIVPPAGKKRKAADGKDDSAGGGGDSGAGAGGIRKAISIFGRRASIRPMIEERRASSGDGFSAAFLLLWSEYHYRACAPRVRRNHIVFLFCSVEKQKTWIRASCKNASKHSDSHPQQRIFPAEGFKYT